MANDSNQPRVETQRSNSRQVPAVLQLGCAHLLGILAITGVLLLFNTLAVSIAYQSWLEIRSSSRRDPRIAQTIVIIGPLLLLFLQYWLYDRLRDWLIRPKLKDG
ncbi:hypothetical protein ETAA8_38300 [Anatilimnocola aggregata]|uniref:Uncharacterized protein n=1 Tax=Anatilimnocola aggregata TaxID=2528021 RepID=A0A517YEQ5_9BACT|nr:hypothetical protein [Anatilimnocola aggregata]QDU28725.1 hypothetical protein ETAA8_38300 [Anatilimnocola aggregata]